MTGLDLNSPLGLDRKPQPSATPSSRRGRAAVGAALGLAAVAAAAGAFFYLHTANNGVPGAEPYAVARIERPVARSAAPAPPEAKEKSAPDVTGSIANRALGGDIEAGAGVRVTREGGGQAPGALIIQVPQRLAVQLMPAPDRRLIDKGRFGALPKIGADGSRPMDVYARPVMTRTDARAGAPRIAILVGGMGLNTGVTRTAVAQLPAAVTLGFAPYGLDLEGQVEQARDSGHEVILQSPMESFVAGEEPGAYTLKAADDRVQTISNLHWQMSRFPGYVGIANFLGAKFTASETSLTPVLREIATRGLFYFDDGSSPRSLARSLAPNAGAPLVVADIVLDAGGRPDEIDAALARLEGLARAKGMAVGVASGLPATVDRIARFSRALENRGITLVPVSALAARPDAVSAKTQR
ncbi:divergent polysaccharide deacetylase family protein [Roseiarcaceae bacterium H3SJ34-1]|uniref:divergent polysaccharide deacetylase family protein n=1 Tax=Terripilifer ovatus TaxID=3032367 RepID=UPI003AB93483|nr:divergent polysaccharide deacetylase family protein [Roseiarcaceae bacterium H3SJ34-1]